MTLAGLRLLAKKYSLPTRKYPPLSVKKGESFVVVLPSAITEASVTDLNRSSPFEVSVGLKAGNKPHREVTFSAKLPFKQNRSPLDVVTLVLKTGTEVERISLGLVVVEEPPGTNEELEQSSR